MANPGPYKRSPVSGQFVTSAFDKMSDTDPVDANGPLERDILARGTGVIPVELAYKVREDLTGPATFEGWRQSRPNPHRRAVAIDGMTGQKVFDLTENDLVSIARQKLRDAAGDDTLIRDLVDPYGAE